MHMTQQMSMARPNEMADAVRRRVASHEDAQGSEAVRDRLSELAAREQAIDVWLCASVVPAASALEAHPSCALDTAVIRATLARYRPSPH
jgi:antitoxin ParD1/3/4